ncbi:MAG: hypothetical protein NVS4B9_24380 [Ktedonobacteraceae bacterium]
MGIEHSKRGKQKLNLWTIKGARDTIAVNTPHLPETPYLPLKGGKQIYDQVCEIYDHSRRVL